jgi:selenocysteine lyase/cysteine desulfurase
VFTAGCQKWLLAPQGCGFFYLSDDVMKVIEYPFMSWLGVDWKMKFSDLFHYDREYFKGAQTFEMGYYVALNLLAMRASAQLFVDLGIENVQLHNYELLDMLAKYLDNNPFYNITSSRETNHRSSIMTFTCRHYRDLHTLLAKHKIICVPREGSIRIAVHLFNNEKDIKRLIGFLDMFAGKHG